MMFSLHLDTAFIVSALAHQHQCRKGTRIPYSMHPAHVAFILQRYGFGEPVVIAGLLHDVLEDMEFGNHTLQEEFALTFPDAALPVSVDAGPFRAAFDAFLDRTFGDRVMHMVRAVTEQKNDGGPPRSWTERKRQQLEHLRQHVDRDTAALKAADTLHNVRSILRELDASEGLDAMRKFKAAPQDAARYYLSVAELVSAQLDGHPLGTEVLSAARQLADRVEREPRRP